MPTYREILNQMKNMSKYELRGVVDHYTAVAMRGVNENTYMTLKESNAAILTTLLAAICADGYFNSDEYYVVQPAIDVFIQEGISYDATLDFIKQANIDSSMARNAVDNFVDSLDPDTKEALIFACAAICAADHNLNDAELSWLNRLLG